MPEKICTSRIDQLVILEYPDWTYVGRTDMNLSIGSSKPWRLECSLPKPFCRLEAPFQLFFMFCFLRLSRNHNLPSSQSSPMTSLRLLRRLKALHSAIVIFLPSSYLHLVMMLLIPFVQCIFTWSFLQSLNKNEVAQSCSFGIFYLTALN